MVLEEVIFTDSQQDSSEVVQSDNDEAEIDDEEVEGEGSSALGEIEIVPKGAATLPTAEIPDDEDDEVVCANMADISETWTIHQSGSSQEGEGPALRFADRIQRVGASWEASVKESIKAKRLTRMRVLQAAGILPEDLEKDPGRKLRVDSWIRSVSADENQRRSKLTIRRKDQEDNLVSPHEVVGWKVRDKEVAWYASPIHNPHGHHRPNDSPPNRRLILRRSIPQDKAKRSPFVSPAPQKLGYPHSGPRKKSRCDTTREASNLAIIREMPYHLAYHPQGMNKKETSDGLSRHTNDRNEWHRWLLKAHARHLNTIFRDTDSEEALGDSSNDRLRVEKDAMIPIPLTYRWIWYRLQYQIRNFPRLGLLLPVENPDVHPSERWRNRSTEGLRLVSTRALLHLMKYNLKEDSTIQVNWAVRHLFPRVEQEATVVQDVSYFIPDDELNIKQRYDVWYWGTLRKAEKLVPDRSPGAIVPVKRRYSRPEVFWRVPKNQVHANLFYILDTIQRNQDLAEPPLHVLSATSSW